jgi:hypothetical protein
MNFDDDLTFTGIRLWQFLYAERFSQCCDLHGAHALSFHIRFGANLVELACDWQDMHRTAGEMSRSFASKLERTFDLQTFRKGADMGR